MYSNSRGEIPNAHSTAVAKGEELALHHTKMLC